MESSAPRGARYTHCRVTGQDVLTIDLFWLFGSTEKGIPSMLSQHHEQALLRIKSNVGQSHEERVRLLFVRLL